MVSFLDSFVTHEQAMLFYVLNFIYIIFCIYFTVSRLYSKYYLNFVTNCFYLFIHRVDGL